MRDIDLVDENKIPKYVCVSNLDYHFGLSKLN